MKIKVNLHQPKEKFIRRSYDESEYEGLRSKDITYLVKKSHLHEKCDNYKVADSQYRLYILKEAADEILSFIEWDQHTEHNHTEVCGFMIGHHYYDETKNIFYSEVESTITVPTDTSTEVYLQLSTDSMFAIEQMLDAYNSENNTDCRFIGWFHTHPNSLPVFMSSTDLITQSRYFSDDLGYAIVLNPHKLYWKAFRSVNCFDVKCMMVNKTRLTVCKSNVYVDSQSIDSKKLDEDENDSHNTNEVTVYESEMRSDSE